MDEMCNVSVSKHLRGEKKGGWICPPTWKLDFTRPLIRIDQTSPAQSVLRIPEPILTAKMFKNNLNYLNTFFFTWTNLKKIFIKNERKP